MLGGTRMIGRALAEDALARGHSVTLFNRGRSDPGRAPGAEHVAGDRTQGPGALRGRTWDAVIDSSGYVPDDVRLSVTPGG